MLGCLLEVGGTGRRKSERERQSSSICLGVERVYPAERTAPRAGVVVVATRNRRLKGGLLFAKRGKVERCPESSGRERRAEVNSIIGSNFELDFPPWCIGGEAGIEMYIGFGNS